MVSRVAPFSAYIIFLAIEQAFALAIQGPATSTWLYPLKTAAVVGLLFYFWPQYAELQGKQGLQVKDAASALVVGLVVYGLWVRMDWPWAMQGDGTAAGYNPWAAGVTAGPLLAGIRLFGAAVVVPVMEELFWRSFLIRYLISSKFETVPLGALTPLSFGATVVLFGLEHDLWLAGMMAGAVYTGLLYYTKRLWPCVLAHGITNLALGIHVLVTHEWKWW